MLRKGRENFSSSSFSFVWALLPPPFFFLLFFRHRGENPRPYIGKKGCSGFFCAPSHAP